MASRCRRRGCLHLCPRANSRKGQNVRDTYTSALIVGAGSGLSASLARLFAQNGMRVALAARSTDKLAALAQETNASLHGCDATDRAQVDKLLAALDPAPDVAVYNASYRTRGPFTE